MFKRICLVSSLIFFSTSLYAKEKLVFALDIIRHGDRTPIYEIPNDPHQWQEGLGQLTTVGMQQEIKLGQALRQKYVNQYHLLPKKYDAQAIYVRSTSRDRTIMSAVSLLSGLYPEHTRSLNFDAPPITTVPAETDNILLAKPNNNLYVMAKRYVLTKKAWHDETKSLQTKLSEWRSKTGMKLNNFESLNQLADNLRIRQLKHVPFPAGISNSDAEKIMSLSEAADLNQFKIKNNYPMGKNCLQAISHYVTAAKSGKTPLKYVLFSGHDSTLLGVMSALDTPLDKNPPYASHLNFSLYENNNRYYVKVSYNDKPVNIPGCNGDICSLAQFSKLGM